MNFLDGFPNPFMDSIVCQMAFTNGFEDKGAFFPNHLINYDALEWKRIPHNT